ncbi:MAG: hypothetical protein MUE53_07100 [Chitinophagales bacterium]|jgi:hypothetical protein|nr:hypothetical protein [Chitinophagales bacterium]
MKIFETYTGNAMLNNALMTIEALGKLKSVSEITPELLLALYKSQDLKSINKRLKSYTMLFTKNGPLKNDLKNGDKIYDTLFNHISSNFENNGENVCEISGLKFTTNFESILEKVFKSVGLDKNEIQKKDATLNRNWFPLIGGLGSDAQALPQAKFTIQIHPICIVIMQFLPLSALLYKGGVLLIDSSNFEFARDFVAQNVKELQKRIQTTSSKDSVENVKDFSKGNYLLQAIKILEDKELGDEYSDLNLWSFSNSGTGASCEIDRVPNTLIQKLIRIKKKPKVSQELVRILSNNESAYSFLNALEANVEWWLLYPNIFGSGKKKVEYEGVSTDFLEAYFTEIGSSQKIEYAKYLAYLIDKYKSNSFDKYLSKTDAWNEKDYRVDLYAVLVEATKKEEWNLYHQFEILDNIEQISIRNTFYNIHKITHFYYQKKVFSKQIPILGNKNSQVEEVCEWLIALIQADENKSKIIKDLSSTQNYVSVGYNDLLIRSFKYASLNIETIIYALYDENLNLSKIGLNELLRIFFNQSEQPNFEIKGLEMPKEWTLGYHTQQWFKQIREFAQDYQAYYFDKYENKQAGKKPFGKFLTQITEIPKDNSGFLRWFEEVLENTNNFLKSDENKLPDKWSDALLYNPQGEFAISFAKFSIKFFLLKQYYFSTINLTQN